MFKIVPFYRRNTNVLLMLNLATDVAKSVGRQDLILTRITKFECRILTFHLIDIEFLFYFLDFKDRFNTIDEISYYNDFNNNA